VFYKSSPLAYLVVFTALAEFRPESLATSLKVFVLPPEKSMNHDFTKN